MNKRISIFYFSNAAKASDTSTKVLSTSTYSHKTLHKRGVSWSIPADHELLRVLREAKEAGEAIVQTSNTIAPGPEVVTLGGDD
jgi:hypothetical protein